MIEIFEKALPYSDIEIPLCSVMPSVTPVCFGTMYTGTQPCVHGIQAYEKPVIIGYGDASLSKIYLERDMDYYFDTIEQVNAKVAELILKDEYDFYVVYNGNYDTAMHKRGTESKYALSEIRANCRMFGPFSEMIQNNWGKHNTLVGFAMDHGCHEIDGECGSHGLDIPEDMNIVHLYKAYPEN